VTVAVRGTVRTADGAAVPGARAFLSGTGHSSVTDREGHFAMLDVSPGRYRLSFTHPRFDTLGVVGPVLEIHATAEADYELTMHTDEEIAQSVCQGAVVESPGQPRTLVYGYVRDGSSPAVVPEATVTAAWRSPMARGPTVGVRNETVEVQGDATGYYQVCGIPAETPFTVRAAQGARRGPEHRVDPLRSPVTRLDVELRRAP
jgi:hypothetical protein